MTDIKAKLLKLFKIEHREGVEKIQALSAQLKQLPAAEYRTAVEAIYRVAHTLKGAARAANLPDIEKFYHDLEDKLDKHESIGSEELSAHVSKIISSCEDSLARLDSPAPPVQVVDKASEPKEVPQVQEIRKIKEEEVVRVESKSLDALRDTGEDMLMAGHLSVQLGTHLARFESSLAELETTIVSRKSVSEVAQSVRGLRADLRQLRRTQKQAAWEFERARDNLEQRLREIRVVAVQDIYYGFGAMVREIAEKQQKEVDFQLNGAGLRIDKHLLESLKGPLMHIVRNAVHHGIETIAERQRKSKAKRGIVTLSFDVRKGTLMARVTDDGAGFHQQVIEQKQRSDTSAFDIIAQAGYSTSATTDAVGGRGMGLAIVQDDISKLRGQVQVGENEGAGLCFTITLPLSFTSQQVLLIRHGEKIYALPLYATRRLVTVSTSAIKTIKGNLVIHDTEGATPLVGFDELLGGTNKVIQTSKESIQVVYIHKEIAQIAIAVDEFVEVRDVLIKALDTQGYAHFWGAVILPDSSVAYVINPWFLSRGGLGATFVQTASEQVVVDRVPRILVVDDSVTTRTLEQSILEGQGYHVTIAFDGAHALRLLDKGEFDLVITDLEMPEVNGFELVSAMKQNKRLAKIPVIMVTSREDAADKERGLKVGADAYIVKASFDQKELIERVEQLL